MPVVVREKRGLEPANDVWYFEIFGDPTQSPGLAAGIGSWAKRFDAPATGDEYEKTGASDTAWTLRVDAGNLGGSGTALGILGVYEATANGLVGDGSTDNRAALNTLANTTIPSTGGTVVFKPGTYRIATSLTLPDYVVCDIQPGALLSVDAGATLTLGPVKDYGHRLFTGSGTCTFSNTSNQAFVRPEWWGFKSDNSTASASLNSSALDAATTAARALQGGIYYGRRTILLPSGFGHLSRVWTIANTQNLVVRGHGKTSDGASVSAASGTQLLAAFLADTTGTVASATNSASSGTLTVSGTPWTVDQHKGRTVHATDGGSDNEYAYITGNTANTLTVVKGSTTSATGWGVTPSAGWTFTITNSALLDHNGLFSCTFENMGLWGDGRIRNGLYLHKHFGYTTSTSSQNTYRNITVSGTWTTGAGLQMGSDSRDGGNAQLQEDLTFFEDITVAGNATSDTDASPCQWGVRVGTGLMANNLNHTFSGINVLRCRRNFCINASNAQVFGGTIQSAKAEEIFVAAGLQGYTLIKGVRTENTRRLLGGTTTYTHPFTFEMQGLEVHLGPDGLNPEAGAGYGYYVDWPFNGTLVMRSSRIGGQDSDTGTVSSATSNTVVVTPAGNNNAIWSANNLVDFEIRITGGPGAGQRKIITANTALTTSSAVTISGTWGTLPTSASTFEVTVVPTVRLGGNNICTFISEGNEIECAPLSEHVRVDGQRSVAVVTGYTELNIDKTTVYKQAGSPVVLGSSSQQQVLAGYGAGLSGTGADTHLLRLATGRWGVPGLYASALRSYAIGTTPAPFCQVDGTTGTSYQYALVAYDGDGNRALRSSATTVSAAAQLTKDNRVRIFPNLSTFIPASKYDVLRSTDGGTTWGLLTTAFYWEFPVMDVGLPASAYTSPSSDGTGQLRVDGSIGFYGTAPVAKPTVTGSRGGNVALQSLLSALASQGLITDSSS